MRRFYVQVDDRTFKVLVDRAVKERRNVRDEAALALERAVCGEREAEQRVPVEARQAVSA